MQFNMKSLKLLSQSNKMEREVVNYTIIQTVQRHWKIRQTQSELKLNNETINLTAL